MLWEAEISKNRLTTHTNGFLNSTVITLFPLEESNKMN
jgi:hypothetical protein